MAFSFAIILSFEGLDFMSSFPTEQLKKLLLDQGVLSQEDFDLAVKDSLRMGQDVIDVLVARNFITRDYFYTLLANFLGVPLANIKAQIIDEATLRFLPEEIAHEKQVILFGRAEDGRFNVAMLDPANLETINFLKQYLNSDIVVFLASIDDLNKGYKMYSQKSANEVRELIEKNISESIKNSANGKIGDEADLPIVSIVDALLSYAVLSRASDIHLEIFESEMLVRYRIDGLLYEIVRVPKEVHPAIIARIKVLSALKLDEHNKPQDGRFRYKAGDMFVDARVSVLPTLYGEKIVMRILPATQRPSSLEEIGMLEDYLKIVKSNLKKTFGMLLVTGPTGSGKTTTLYTMLGILNKPEVNISTIEDPIEFGIPNVNQTQINTQAGLTFADGLRALVRQDPNVIMIGEIRDRDTAEIAVHSALTGSLVLSTLHTNNAATAIPRLLDIGVLPFLVSAVLNLIVAQRLVRRICLECIVSYKPEPGIIEAVRSQFEALNLGSTFKPPKILYKGEGCVMCNHVGYKGRLGIYELLQITPTIQQLIVSPEFTLDALDKQARKEGMLTMFEDGLRKAERGMTTIEEVLRVIRE